MLLVPKACMMPSTKRTGRLCAFPFIIPLASTKKSVREICELNIFRVLKFSLRPCLNQCVILNYLPFECLCLKCTALSLPFVRDCRNHTGSHFLSSAVPVVRWSVASCRLNSFADKSNLMLMDVL